MPKPTAFPPSLPLLLIVATAACGSGASSEPGLDALLRVTHAQYVPGLMPAAADGPPVTAVESVNNTVRPGQQQKRLSGRLGAGARAVALGFSGDPGYWIIPAGPADLVYPNELTFDTRYSLAPTLPLGRRDLLLRAVDDAGRFGPVSTLSLLVQAATADGVLVVRLTWDTESDLDLHVVDPAGVDIWTRNINSYQTEPGDPIDPDALARGGMLDFDSNAQCQIDGRRQENVLWKQTPPSGRYIVRVDTFSLCNEVAARWNISVQHEGRELARAAGYSGDSDTRLPHVSGGGVFALEFNIP